MQPRIVLIVALLASLVVAPFFALESFERLYFFGLLLLAMLLIAALTCLHGAFSRLRW